MNNYGSLQLIKNGTITSPAGFVAGATSSGIKRNGELDLGIIHSEIICKAVGFFTRNKIQANPILLNKENLKDGYAQAIIANSGCANACTGIKGYDDAKFIASLVAERLNIKPEHVILASTGVIGVRLPVDKIANAVRIMEFDRSKGDAFAKAILTTDRKVKQIAIQVQDVRNGDYTIAGVAKGAGMINPDLGTMFCFITTDANVESKFMKNILKRIVDCTFNMISVDGDTSPSDIVVMLANGKAENRMLNSSNGALFKMALNNICEYLAKSIVADGEGSTKLMEIVVRNAASENSAKIIAKTIANSILVKSAIHGNDPNWGRIIVAIGRSGENIIPSNISLKINEIPVFFRGTPVEFNKNKLMEIMTENETIKLEIDLSSGSYEAVAWGCDLSEEYVTINSAYTT